MSREDQRRTVRVQREELIKESIATYSKAFDRLRAFICRREHSQNSHN